MNMGITIPQGVPEFNRRDCGGFVLQCFGESFLGRGGGRCDILGDVKGGNNEKIFDICFGNCDFVCTGDFWWILFTNYSGRKRLV